MIVTYSPRFMLGVHVRRCDPGTQFWHCLDSFIACFFASFPSDACLWFQKALLHFHRKIEKGITTIVWFAFRQLNNAITKFLFGHFTGNFFVVRFGHKGIKICGLGQHETFGLKLNFRSSGASHYILPRLVVVRNCGEQSDDLFVYFLQN